jgi:ADP-heptose:LPS heptosyltransferase
MTSSKALVICTGGGIGDVLLATPVMRALHERFDSVVALTAPEHRGVLAGNPDLVDVWTDDVSFARQVARIREMRFDAAVVTWATLRASALPFASGVPVRVGQARRAYSGFFTQTVAVRSELGDRTTHWTQILLDYARAIGCDTADAVPRFVVSDEARRNIGDALVAAHVAEPYVVLHPTRGIAAARERWPTERLAELARAIATEYAARVVVTGTAADREIAERVAGDGSAISLAGQTSIAEFGALAEGALAVVAMDSGPMHVAAAVGAPTLGIYALQSDEPDRWAPLGPRTAVLRATYRCPPAHRKETCPDFACVAALDVPRVLAALGGLLRPKAEIAKHGNADAV